MKENKYIAHIPLKYFSGLSLDIFPGKLLRGRVISADKGTIRIELGGAILEAKSDRILKKGEVVTLRVKEITAHGLSLEIAETKSPKTP